MIGRAIVVLIPALWYVTVRCAIFYFFIGHPLPEQPADFFDWTRCGYSCFFDWWWSWLIALPATAFSMVIVGGIAFAIGWIVFGDDDEDEHEHVQRQR